MQVPRRSHEHRFYESKSSSREERPVPGWPKSAVRIGFGLIWLVDAVFKWLPDFHKGILGMAQGAATGQPAWLHWWFNLWVGAVKAHPSLWAYGDCGA
jgi:hypothetical protein